MSRYTSAMWDEYCETNRFTPDMVFSSEINNWYYPWATWHTEGAEAREKTAECQPIISI